MGEVLKSWLRTRLGAIMDLTPEIFGHYTRDGKLLAQILHSYDIINCGQLDTIISTRDPALSRVNLKHLRVWLRFLGIDVEDECIEEISRGKGTASLRLFYKVYLCLESKDSLHFITLQMEREKYIPTSTKFDVTTVCEDPPPYKPAEHHLANRLCEGEDTVKWCRTKCAEILRACKKEREKFEEKYPVNRTLEAVQVRDAEVPDKKQEQMKQLNEFARIHHPGVAKLKKDSGDDLERKHEKFIERPEMAKLYVDSLKNRRKQINTADVLKSKMQRKLLSELWEKLVEKEERELDEEISRRVLDQSRYEKQIMKKLCEIREQKSIIAENRTLVEELVIRAREKDLNAQREYRKENDERDKQDTAAEAQRMAELRSRIHGEKVRRIRGKHQRICLEAVEDLLEIVVEAAEYRKSTEGRIPKAIWCEWKGLFVKGQPISGVINIEEYNIEYDKEIAEEGEEEFEKMPEMDSERKQIIRDSAFEDYHELNPPWDEFSPLINDDINESLELGKIVLGYIVHRLLEFAYPYPMNSKKAPLSRPKMAAILLGVKNSSLYEPLKMLLDKSNMRLIRMEDAINYCLQKYKEEMSDVEYIDLNILTASTAVLKEMVTGRKSKPDAPRKKPETGRSRKSSATVRSLSQSKNTDEKQTQTPRTIPYDDVDPILTDSAYFGKWTYEFLTLGEPISNELSTNILIEYLKNLSDVEGWVLMEYPDTYEQMARLETALTGREVPSDPEILDFEEVNIEDIDPVSPRIVFQEEDVDVFTLNRQSKLLPNPTIRKDNGDCTSTFTTIYVRAIPKKRKENDSEKWMNEPESGSSIDKFYADFKIAYAFYYSTFDLPTLKALCRLLMGKAVEKKTSWELFGDAAEDFKREMKQGVERTSSVIIEPLIFRINKEEYEDENDEEGEEEDEEETAIENMEDQDNLQGLLIDEMEPRIPKPGEKRWSWVNLPIPSNILENLVSLWTNLEKSYTEDLKELLFLRSVHFSSVIPYKDSARRKARAFISRGDNKQELLQDFQEFYNAIYQDIREDEDVKCELHSRVADLQSELWNICDRRRQEAEDERKRLIGEQWTALEAMFLFNLYIGMIQVEVDRCVDTLRMIQDYYMSMLHKPLQDFPNSKIILKRVDLDTDPPIKFHENASPVSADKLIGKETKEKSRNKVASPKARISAPDAVDRDILADEIGRLFINVNNEQWEPRESSVYETIMENLRYAKNIVDSISSVSNETIKKEDAAVSKGIAKDVDSKKESAKSLVENTLNIGNSSIHGLLLEWRSAANFEANRARFRLELLSSAALSDVTFLLETMRTTFHAIYEDIVDRYKREIKSVNDMANVFCYAIEEARPIQEKMVLKGDHFFMKPPLIILEPQISSGSIKEIIPPTEFRFAQLARLLEIFRWAAPSGILNERSLIFILEDLLSQGQEEGGPFSLPSSWYQLRPKDIPDIVNQLFESTEFIDWREFLIYALDLPMPSHEEILKARNHFRTQDPELKEIVSEEQYNRVPLWFLESTAVVPGIRDVLRGNFERNWEELYEEELQLMHRDMAATNVEKETFYAERKSTRFSQEMLRLVLAKELLCQMYLVDRDSVNYTALLLAFCKDPDPKEGFAKALTLAVGSRVCADVVEGENYVAELEEQRRLLLEKEMAEISEVDSLRLEAIQAAEEVFDIVLTRACRRISQIEEARSSIDRSLPPRRHIRIQDLDNPDAPVTFPPETNSAETDSSSNSDGGEFGIPCVSSTLIMSESWERVKEPVTYWLPRDVCLIVLSAALPCLVSEPDLFHTGRSLRETLNIVYGELRDENLCDEENVVLAHRLLNHDIIIRLLKKTSKFTVQRMGSIVQKCLREREASGSRHGTGNEDYV